MRVQASVPAYGQVLQAAIPEDVLETISRALAEAFRGKPGGLRAEPQALQDDRPDLPALLAPQQVGDLWGISRNTVDRMADDGELPAIVLREGSRQRMVRIPKAFVLKVLADLNAGARISLRDYTATWQAESASRPAAAGVPSATEVA
jgi:hypothetical protein